MAPSEDNVKMLFLRLLIAVPFFILAWICIGNAVQEKGLILNLLGGVVCLLIGVFSIGKPLAGLFAEPSGSLFNPDDPTGSTLPMYSVPKAKFKKGQYEEAFLEYQKIAEEFPDEVKPYLEMMNIAGYNFKNREQVEEIYRVALVTIKDDKKREMIERTYHEIISV